ncbi:MAG: nonstructural protein [Arizlama microvirus]|nr:MAG: nonstructural protein [Arizlama microvirus]
MKQKADDQTPNVKIYNVYDSKAEAWGQPLFYDCRANALRSLGECVNATSDQQNQIAKYPSDFTFFEVGEYDKWTGLITVYETKINLGLAIEYKKAENLTLQN